MGERKKSNKTMRSDMKNEIDIVKNILLSLEVKEGYSFNKNKNIKNLSLENDFSELSKKDQEFVRNIFEGKAFLSEIMIFVKNLIPDKFDSFINDYFEDRIKIHISYLKDLSIINEKEVWERLNNIHILLCKLYFKEHISLRLNLENFIHDFDRIDDPDMRKYIREKLFKNKLTYA
jgi:hypothetical protein